MLVPFLCASLPTGAEEVAAIEEQQEAARCSNGSRTSLDCGNVPYSWLDSTPSILHHPRLSRAKALTSSFVRAAPSGEGRLPPSASHQVQEATPHGEGRGAPSVGERPSHHGGHQRCRSHAPREADRARLLACCSGKQDGGGKLLACCSGGAGQRKEMRLHLPIGDKRADRRGWR